MVSQAEAVEALVPVRDFVSKYKVNGSWGIIAKVDPWSPHTWIPHLAHIHTPVYIHRQWLLRKMKLAGIHIRKAEGSHGQRRQIALEGDYGPPYSYTAVSFGTVWRLCKNVLYFLSLGLPLPHCMLL